MDSPDDKPKQVDAFEDPKLYVVIGEDKFPKYGLETAFADFSDGYAGETNADNNDSTMIGGVVCSCNKVRVKQYSGWSFPEPKTRSSSSSSGSSSSSSGRYCRCVPVH
jgi:hypothetical protein